MKIGQRVKTINPIATGVITETAQSDNLLLKVKLNKPTEYQTVIWKQRWFLENEVKFINNIINKLK